MEVYWVDGHDWWSWEATLNSFDQFIIEICGLEIRFIHQRSRHEDAFSLAADYLGLVGFDCGVS